MPLQNRVTPFGEIVADPARGMLTGNRGILHVVEADGTRRLGPRRWTTTAWICCTLDFRGRRRVPMSPGTWTELFFLDEVTALAAGHRPCAYCRRADFEAFRAAVAGGLGLAEPPRAPELDRRLHAERLTPPGAGPRVRRLWPMAVDAVPPGAMAAGRARPGSAKDGPVTAWLRDGPGWRRWGLSGYGPVIETGAETGTDGPGGPPVASGGTVAVLTPPTVLAALAGGYRPARHPTASHPTAGTDTAETARP